METFQSAVELQRCPVNQSWKHCPETLFLEHRQRGFLPEGAVDKLVISPLLDLAGLYEPRFTSLPKYRDLQMIAKMAAGDQQFSPHRRTHSIQY